MQGFYRDPRPPELREVIGVLAKNPTDFFRGQPIHSALRKCFFRTDDLELDVWHHHDTMPVSFCAQVFRRDTAVVAPILDDAESFSEGMQRSLWLAVWWSGNAALLRDRGASKRARAYVHRLLSLNPVPITKLPFDGPVILDMLWMAFFATGDPIFVQRIVLALELLCSPDRRRVAIAQSAMWSLTGLRAAHPIVAETCDRMAEDFAHLDRLTVGAVMREALLKMSEAPPR
jgi:hypothetical protein